MIDIDAAACKKAGISPSDILTTMQGYYGGLYASNFNRFGKMYRVMVQADPSYRTNLESLKNIKVRNGSEMAPISQFMLPADPASVKPTGEWNTIVIKVNNGKVTHIQNGKKVVQYTLWTKEWDNMVANSKFKDFPGFTEGISHEGFIGLQDHGYTVWFRNIKIRELK